MIVTITFNVQNAQLVEDFRVSYGTPKVIEHPEADAIRVTWMHPPNSLIERAFEIMTDSVQIYQVLIKNPLCERE